MPAKADKNDVFRRIISHLQWKKDKQRFGLTLPITYIRSEIFRTGCENFVHERSVGTINYGGLSPAGTPDTSRNIFAILAVNVTWQTYTESGPAGKLLRRLILARHQVLETSSRPGKRKRIIPWFKYT
jgi:hypothetical protein